MDIDSDEIFIPPPPLDAMLAERPFYLSIGRREDRAIWRNYSDGNESFSQHGLKVREDVQPTRGHESMKAAQIEDALEFFKGVQE